MIVSEIDAIQQLAIANQLQRLDGDYAALQYKVKGKINLLIYNNVVSPFYELILDYLDSDRKLIDITAATYKKMREKKLTKPQWQLAYETLNYISFFLLKNVQDRIIGQDPNNIYNIVVNDNKKVADLNDIAKLMKKDEKYHSDVSILENLDFAFENGWQSNTLKECWLQKEKLEIDPTKFKKFLLGDASSQVESATDASRRSSGGRSRRRSGKSRKNSGDDQAPSVPLWDKPQQMRDCPPTKGSDGTFYMPCTSLVVDKDDCMNLNIWGACALGGGCKKKKRCVYCKEQTHGVRDCKICNFERFIKKEYRK